MKEIFNSETESESTGGVLGGALIKVCLNSTKGGNSGILTIPTVCIPKNNSEGRENPHWDSPQNPKPGIRSEVLRR